MLSILVIDADHHPTSDNIHIWYMWRDMSPHVLQIDCSGFSFMQSLPEDERVRHQNETRVFWHQAHPHERDKKIEAYLNTYLTKLEPNGRQNKEKDRCAAA